jgi:hypothetical protein
VTRLIVRAALCSALFLCAAEALFARPTNTMDGETRRDYFQFWFLWEKTTAPAQKEWILHPLASRYTNQERGFTYQTFLYPVFASQYTHRWSRWNVFFFLTGEKFYHEDSGEDEDMFLTPLIYWGKGDTTRERYISIFPLFGRINNKLSYSEINYVLFPLYASWSHREYEARGVLWPIVMWGGSPTRSEFRIFPFYSRKVHEGKYARYSVLWPFFQYSRERMDKKDPSTQFLAWPFYGRKWSDSGDMTAHTVLWPLFSWGGDKKTDAYDVNLFWILFQYSRNTDPYINKLIVFPLFGSYTFGSKGSVKDSDGVYSRSFAFITPFFMRQKISSALIEGNDLYIFPFFMTTHTFYKRERDEERYVKVWPVFSYSKSTSGALSFRMLTLLPVRSDEFERVWGPYYSLVEYNRYENQDRYFSLLFRTYSRYWNDVDEHHFLAGFNIDHTPEVTGVEFLGGFLGFRREYKRMETHSNVLRLFWFSI